MTEDIIYLEDKLPPQQLQEIVAMFMDHPKSPWFFYQDEGKWLMNSLRFLSVGHARRRERIHEEANQINP